MIYKRSETGSYWYCFKARGIEIRESTRTKNLRMAESRERKRREEIENGGPIRRRRRQTPLFRDAADLWLESRRPFIALRSATAYEQYVRTLKAEFGRRLVSDIDADDIRRLQHKRLSEAPLYDKGRKRTDAGWSSRSVNYELGVLRQILKRYGFWSPIADEVERLPERSDVGRAVTPEHEGKLLEAIGKSGSPALLPLFVLGLDTGLRASELRALRRRDLTLEWKDGVIVAGGLTVPKSKTEAGTGRFVPFTQRVCGTLSLWLSRFPDAPAEAYVFPRHQVVQDEDREPILWEVDVTRPMGEWKRSWRRALREAKCAYRWHDLRHSFVSRLAESPRVSEQTIRSLAGHVSKKMLERYSHIRTAAKQDAIAVLEAYPRSEGGTKGGTPETERPGIGNEPGLTH